MPGGNGVELPLEIRHRRPEISIVLTAGYAGNARREAEQRNLAVLAKPFWLDKLDSSFDQGMHPPEPDPARLASAVSEPLSAYQSRRAIYVDGIE